MKKTILITLQIMALFLIQSITNNSNACTIANTSGSIGTVTPAGGPVPDYITDIVANGTSTLSVTQTPSVGSPTTSNIALGSGYCTATGSWHGAKITSASGAGSGGNIVLIINGSTALTFGTNCGPVGSASWAGSTGGVTKISGNGTKELTFDGYNSVTGLNQQWKPNFAGTCTVSPSYGYDTSNNYVLNATAVDATSVEFFVDGSSVGTDSSSPFSKTLNVGGSHDFSVIASFSGGSISSIYGPIYLPQLSIADDHTSCMEYAGRAYCWGKGSWGALGNGGTSHVSSPSLINSLIYVSSIAAHAQGACAVSQGGVYCWGKNNHGIIGYDPASVSYITTPELVVSTGSNVVQVAAGTDFACYLNSSGRVKCLGDGSKGQMGNFTTTADNWSPWQQPSGLTSGVTKIAAGGNTACAIKSGEVFCWGADDKGQVGDGGSANTSVSAPNSTGLTGMIDIAVGYRHSCALSSSGAVYCWGRNSEGQLGIGSADTSAHVSPILSTVWSNIAAISSGHSLATFALATTTLKGIGENGAAQLGGGSTSTYELSPIAPSGMTGTINASIGGYNSCAFNYGHVYCWGDNSYGEVGNTGGSNPQLTPIQVTGF